MDDMELCRHNHNQIVFESTFSDNKCPLCVANKKIQDLEWELSDVNKERDDIQLELDEVKDKVYALDTQVEELNGTIEAYIEAYDKETN